MLLFNSINSYSYLMIFVSIYISTQSVWICCAQTSLRLSENNPFLLLLDHNQKSCSETINCVRISQILPVFYKSCLHTIHVWDSIFFIEKSSFAHSIFILCHTVQNNLNAFKSYSFHSIQFNPIHLYSFSILFIPIPIRPIYTL